jgi:hypothetical protein
MIQDAPSLRSHQSKANEIRAEYLAGIYTGVLTVDDVVDAAISYEPALLRISLQQLLLSQPGVGRTAARRIVARTLEYLDAPSSTRGKAASLNLAWLADRRTGGRRYICWNSALAAERPRRVAAGFPFAAA